MQPHQDAMNDETFYGFMHPYQNRRFYLALVVSIILFPLIAVGLLAGTVFMIVPAIAFALWVGMRVFFANMLGDAILVSTENYPRIFALTEELKGRIGYAKPIYVFVYESGSFNAYLRHLFFRRAIFLNSELLQTGVTDHEVRWLIGRFVGYMRARQQSGVLGWVIRAAQRLLVFNVFIMPYERAMVHTGDRLALAEIGGDLVSATSALQKLLVGRELGYSVNPEGFIAQHRQVKGSIFAFLARLGRSHPHMTARYVDLVLFARAFFPEQYRVFEASNPGLPVDLAQLGISQLTDSDQPRKAGAPWGWSWATATALTLLTMGALIAVAVDGLSGDPAYSASAGSEITSPEAADQALVPAPPSASVSLQQEPSTQEPPPNTHYEAGGGLKPNDGCRWVSDDPKDFRVVCT